jgi:nucleoside-diphosphate-sugar epimerase
MKLLITGVYGFLGFYLAKKLSESHTVIGIYHSYIKKDNDSDISFFNDIELLTTVPDVIIMCHAAVSSGNHSISNQILYDTNVNFTQKLYIKYPHVKIIYISSVSIFGLNAELVTETSLDCPVSTYSISKLWAEKIILQNKNNYIIRFSSLYGNEIKENTLIPNYCNQALNNQIIDVWGDGTRKQNYIHIEDAISLIEKVIAFDGIINFPILGVSNKEYSNLEIAQIVAKNCSAKINFKNKDNVVMFQYNNQLTQNTFNWQSEMEIGKGIAKYLEWKRK